MTTARILNHHCRLLVPMMVLVTLYSMAAPPVPVGTYLYAQDESLTAFKGRLTVRFRTPGDRLVVAYGRANRKDRKSREGTTEAERERFKPIKARMEEQGQVAQFDHLAPDFYDLLVIDTRKMLWHEGLQLHASHDDTIGDEELAEYKAEVIQSLSPTKDRIGGWEAFFDHKDFIRFETDGFRGCVLVQQMRLGKAFAESGAELEGCVHSIDLCWVEQTRTEDNTWQVVTRQQLFRGELKSRDFFAHHFVPALHGIRVGIRHHTIGPIDLPVE